MHLKCCFASIKAAVCEVAFTKLNSSPMIAIRSKNVMFRPPFLLESIPDRLSGSVSTVFTAKILFSQHFFGVKNRIVKAMTVRDDFKIQSPLANGVAIMDSL